MKNYLSDVVDQIIPRRELTAAIKARYPEPGSEPSPCFKVFQDNLTEPGTVWQRLSTPSFMPRASPFRRRSFKYTPASHRDGACHLLSEVEELVLEAGRRTSIDVSILRQVLVYGQGCKGQWPACCAGSTEGIPAGSRYR